MLTPSSRSWLQDCCSNKQQQLQQIIDINANSICTGPIPANLVWELSGKVCFTFYVASLHAQNIKLKAMFWQGGNIMTWPHSEPLTTHKHHCSPIHNHQVWTWTISIFLIGFPPFLYLKFWAATKCVVDLQRVWNLVLQIVPNFVFIAGQALRRQSPGQTNNDSNLV